MKIVNEEAFEISGFGGVRERVLLLDRATFGAGRGPGECVDAFGGCGYLANAWFLPGGETGMHHHDGMDIVSVIPRGRMYHQGSHGTGYNKSPNDDGGNWVNAGQTQLQRDGNKGIRHNELNPSDKVQPMMQVWIKPEPGSAAPEYHVLDSEPNGLTCVYGGELFPARMRVDILRLDSQRLNSRAGDDERVMHEISSAERHGDLAAHTSRFDYHFSADEGPLLMFVWQGRGEIREPQAGSTDGFDGGNCNGNSDGNGNVDVRTFQRGDLIFARGCDVYASEECGMMVIRESVCRTDKPEV